MVLPACTCEGVWRLRLYRLQKLTNSLEHYPTACHAHVCHAVPSPPAQNCDEYGPHYIDGQPRPHKQHVQNFAMTAASFVACGVRSQERVLVEEEAAGLRLTTLRGMRCESCKKEANKANSRELRECGVAAGYIRPAGLRCCKWLNASKISPNYVCSCHVFTLSLFVSRRR
ncbi:hypothetical protein P153DRAFT_145434 [Dothidotthia symphoricarpi CBS 119687]|uniref:Uncharacterized protein n=1 Tax=Dothidotthia symphoricarpi CBS 119687 TaxID=1392245 RepID=A0A6A5ZWR9_9PLEO|nr:uncharacterized protein P153DRAFT_145434 [Dothidotthia symphoricarpi CBS 119687]KAF2123746.1 hypothetical protein P153DRAFT_145434 [Dothidotthia symphoricarpi CBS 119687]